MRFLIALFAVTTLAYAQPDSLHVIWDKRGAGEESHFGVRVFALGDQNNDGYTDFVVSSGGSGVPGQVNEPRFDLFHGGNPPDTIPYMVFKGEESPYRELWGKQTIGDMNGDGYIDWWTQYGFGPQDDSIVVEFYWGGPSADTIPDYTFGFSADNGWSGVGLVGDFNGDGRSDFFFYDGGGVTLPVDITYVFFGGNPPHSTPDFVLRSNPTGSQNSLPRAFGDLDGDGYSDLVTATNYVHPTTYLYMGSNPPDTVADYVWPDFRVDRVLIVPSMNGDQPADLVVGRSLQMDVHFGGQTMSSIPNYTLTFPGCDLGPTEMSNAGDVNGDGYGDLTAISDCDMGFGALRLYLGHPWLNTDPVLSIDGATMPLDLIGICHAAGLGDVNGDGIEDLAIGATNQMTYGQAKRGRVVILAGDTTLRVDITERHDMLPRELAVQVFPNPFNSQTTIALDVPTFSAKVDLTIYNVLGQGIRHTELRNVLGRTTYHFDGADLPTGVYLLRVQAGSLTNTQKLLLVR